MSLAPLLDRCPVSWRPALLVCAASRAWPRTVLAWALALPMVALMARARAELGTAVLMYAPPLLALGIVGRAFTLVRRPTVWTAIFARAGAGPGDLWRLAGLTGALALAASWSVAVFALAGLRSAAPLPTTGIISLGLFRSRGRCSAHSPSLARRPRHHGAPRSSCSDGCSCPPDSRR